MAEYYLKKLLGGVANGLDVPEEWDGGRQTWVLSGIEETSEYTRRQYYHGADVLYVWVEVSIPHDAFIQLMWWHREISRSDVIDAQKSLLNDSMSSANSYTNVIMVVGFAALFTLWTQLKGQLTPATLLASGLFIALSVLFFIGWEIFGMILRSTANIAIGQAVNNPADFERHMMNYREKQMAIMRRFYPVWAIVVSITIVLGVSAFVILLSGMLHGAWLEFLTASMKAAKSSF